VRRPEYVFATEIGTEVRFPHLRERVSGDLQKLLLYDRRGDLLAHGQSPFVGRLRVHFPTPHDTRFRRMCQGPPPVFW
jgi:hypothetical protein